MVSSNQETGADSLDRYYLQEAETAHDDNKIMIKLKMPKSDEEVEQGETNSSAVKKEHYCSDCKKSFSSGKALGGHMSSAHVQAGKDYPSRRLRMKNSNKFKQHGSVNSNGFGGDGGKEIVCGICGKNFPTRKSLYGHMRCHPDRDYRGMQPPESKKIRRSSSSDQVDEPPLKEVKEYSPQRSTPSSQSDADHQDGDGDNDDDESLGTHPPVNKDFTTDLTRFLSRWAVKGHRGRQSNNPIMVSISDQSPRGDVKQLSDAAYSLVNLSNGIHRRNEEEEEEEEEDRSDSMTPDGENVDAKSMNLYVANKEVKELQGKPKRLSKRKRNSGDDCYEDVRRASKKDQRQFTPVKKLIIGARKPERQTLQPSTFEGKGKAPMEPKFEKFVGTMYESGYGFNKSGDDDDDDDSEMTPESQDQEYLECKRRKNSEFVPYNKRIEKNEVNEKSLSTAVAEKKEITPDKYKCSTCNKCFTTHQALGGHRSSHNKLKMSIQNNTVDSSSAGNQSNSNIISRVLLDSGFKLVENPHQCQICNKIFSSGQALGGHMRSHTNAPSSQGDESSQEDIRYVQKVLDFDLNELPDMDDDAAGKN